MSLNFRYIATTPATISGHNVPEFVTTGTWTLKKDPYSSTTYTLLGGTNGVWYYDGVEDGYYKLYKDGGYVDSFGIQYLNDDSPIYSSLGIISDFSVSGQANFYNSINFNWNDLAHAKNIQVYSFSTTAGLGILFQNPIQMSDADRIASNFASLTSNNYYGNALNRFAINPEYIGIAEPSLSGLITRKYADATHAKLTTGNNFTGNNNFSQYPVFNGTGSVTLPKQFATKEYVDTAVLTANFSSITAAFVNQVSTNVIRLLANGNYNLSQKVANTWSTAMKMAKDSITGSLYSATKQMIISIEGNGETATSIPITNTDIGTYLYPNVHIKGVHQSVTLELEDDSINSGTVASKCIFEDVTIRRKDLGTGVPSFSNITFVNCFFDFEVGGLYFTNCNFRGSNVIKNSGNIYFTNCLGTTVYTNITPIISGTVPPYIISDYL